MFVAILIATSCTDDDPIQVQLLSGDWILDNITLTSGELITPPAPVNLLLTQSEENPSSFSFVGTVICNQYGGDFSFLSENTVDFEGVATTEQLCVEDDPTGTFQGTYFDVFGQSVEFNIGENTITIVSQEGTTLNFSRAN